MIVYSDDLYGSGGFVVVPKISYVLKPYKVDEYFYIRIITVSGDRFVWTYESESKRDEKYDELARMCTLYYQCNK